MASETDRPNEERPTTFPWPPVLLAGSVIAAVLLGRLAPLPWPGLDDMPARVIGIGFGLGHGSRYERRRRRRLDPRWFLGDSSTSLIARTLFERIDHEHPERLPPSRHD